MSSINPRKLAVVALCKVDAEKAYSNIALNAFLKDYTLNNEDKSLVTAIFYGTLDRKITLDYVLSSFIKSGLKKLKPFTLNLLRAALYQIMYMDRIPDSAAVNESVKIIKASKESYNASFVNGVLRNILRSNISLPSDDSISSLSVRYSCPVWIIELLLDSYDFETVKTFLEATLSAPKTYLRVNTLRTNKEKLKAVFLSEGVKVTDTGEESSLIISNYSSVSTLESFKNGLFHIQDIACQKAVEMLGICDNDTVLDICSAPGGKAFTANTLASDLHIVATDIAPNRVELIRKGARRLGFKNIDAKVLDATMYCDSLGLFNCVICDVPCSGLGVLSRKPEIKYKEPDDFAELIKIQYTILCNAAKYLKNGGKLLYSTCTLNKAENEENVFRFLNEHSDFTLSRMKTFLPQTDASDGFFAAVLTKN